jgi:hypothetical protein
MKSKPLPREYKILDHIIDLKLREFELSCGNTKTLSVKSIDSNIWFDNFCSQIEMAIGEKKYLPVVRLCDGEYIFLTGKNLASKRLGYFHRFRITLKESLKQLFKFKLVAGGENRYKSGSYTSRERKEFFNSYISSIRKISEIGILAMHFSWSDVPFTEGLWPSIKKIFDKGNIIMDENNYVPFYFVYALLSGSKSKIIFDNRNILVINGATGDKKRKIISNLQNRGVKNVFWRSVSEDRSLFDLIDLNNLDSQLDLVLVGAGVGKLNIINQLAPLNIPCIDIGFYFEILYNDRLKYERAMCATDDDLIANSFVN